MSVTAQDHDVEINGLRVHYRQWGSAGRRPLILLHASGCHVHWWDEVAPLLAADFDVFAPDLRGHGDSGRPEAPDYHFDASVADLVGLVEHLGLQDFDLIGHSMGGVHCPALRQHAAQGATAFGGRRYVVRCQR